MGRFTTLFHNEQAVAEQARSLGVDHTFREVALAMAMPGNAGREMLFTTKAGEQRTHSMTLNRVVDDRGHTTGFVSTSEDIHDRVLAQRRIEDALATERLAVERLREVDAVKDAFVSSVSHELRTPITSIVGYLEMLQEDLFGELNAGQRRAVDRVAGNSARLLGLIDDLLTLSRVQDEKLTSADRAFDLRTVVRAGHDVVAPAWQQRELAVDLDLPAEPVPFVGDRDMVERVVVNLVGNAVKFTPDGGRLGVRLGCREGEALLEVSDSGIGIPRQEQDQLFSRFFRSSVAQKQAIPGSGLGLSIAKAVVEHHGGTIEVDSDLGAGTTFRVRLPVVV
jgi:signal transduction histidine kinase